MPANERTQSKRRHAKPVVAEDGAGVNVIGQDEGKRFVAFHGDTVDVARGLPDASVDFAVFSPPFASLYTYSNSARDMGNVRNDDEFFAHYAYLVREQRRVMRPGRLTAIHCMLMPTSKERDGHIGLRDFRGDIIRAYQAEGFIFHSEVCIWKDPVTAMQRTKALGLLHKTIRKDSSMSRQGIADYLVVMRTPGTNDKPVAHTHEEFPVERWQRYASPVWASFGSPDDEGFLKCSGTTDPADDSSAINMNDTLQYRSARENEDERHICPLQLEVIRRSVRLWTAPDDVVWSPFMGIGSEGYVALQEGRRFVGAELKRSYYEQAVRNLREAESVRQVGLFAGLGE
jgi:DNA modification methylase